MQIPPVITLDIHQEVNEEEHGDITTDHSLRQIANKGLNKDSHSMGWYCLGVDCRGMGHDVCQTRKGEDRGCKVGRIKFVN